MKTGSHHRKAATVQERCGGDGVGPRARLSGYLLLLVVLLAGPAARVAVGEAGWAVHYYGGPSFWYHGGAMSVATPELAVDLNRVKWPPNNSDPEKGPLFNRARGWSLAAYATLKVDTSGEYRFAVEKAQAFLRVGSRQVDVSGVAPVRLSAGEVPLALFIKPAANPTHATNNVVTARVFWQPPGAAERVPIPEAVLSHDEADLKREPVYAPDVPLVYEQGVQRRHAHRDFTVELPESGPYEIAAHFSHLPRQFQVWLDGYPLLYAQGERAGVSGAFYGASDRAGATDLQRTDFFHRVRAVRPLSKGPHVLTVYAHYGPWIWGDEMKEAMRQFRAGLTRMGPDDPSTSLAVYAKGRDDMVLTRGETLRVAVEQATDKAETYRMEIAAQRGDGEVLWGQEVSLPGGKTWTTSEFTYPCDREGAFEYVVRDAAGQAVDGPWAFVVVDPTPLRPPRAGSAAGNGEAVKVLVDSVDCTLAEDPAHKFRDNGTSEVVETPIGRYRVTGTADVRRIGYVKDGDAWRRAQAGEEAKDSYWAVDWFAYTLKVAHPGKPHLVVGRVPNDIRRLVSVYATDQVTGHYNGWVLDAGEAPEAGPFSPVAFVVWPNGDAIDVCVWCSNNNHGSKLNRQGAMASIELYELPEGLPALPEAAGGWAATAQFGWQGEQVNLGVNERTMPSLWPGNDLVPGTVSRNEWGGAAYHDWSALQASWERFGQLALYRGDNLYISPVHTYGMNLIQGAPQLMLPKLWDIYSKGYRARVVDPMERDIFKLMLLTAQKYGVRLVADFMVHRLEDLAPTLAEQAGEAPEGILLAGYDGKPWRAPSGITMLNPAHPVARRYLVDLMDAMGKRYGAYPAFAGVRTRQWKGWPSGLDAWFYNDTLGCDDFTVGLFCQETGAKVPTAEDIVERAKARQVFLMGPERERWLDWRCRQVLTLREAMLAALRRHSPGAVLISDAPFSREGGLDEKLLAGKPGLGWQTDWQRFGGEGVEWNHPDPVEFATFDVREPASLRRTLQNLQPGMRGYPEGMCGNQSYRSHPYQLEAPALALADGRLETCFYGGQWCLPPADEGLRRFVQAWRAIPPLEYARYPGEGGEQGPVACWSAADGRDLVMYLVNRTPRPRPVDLVFDVDMRGAVDLVSGRTQPTGRKLRVELDPFMASVFKVQGVKSIVELTIPAHLREVAALGRWVDHLRDMRLRAQGGVQVRHGAGPALAAKAGEQDGDLGFADDSFTFDPLIDPIEAAWQADRPFEVARLFDVFHRDHLWWYEAFGWPDDFYVPMDKAGGQHTAGENLRERLKKTEGDIQYTEVPSFKGKFYVIPSGRAVVLFNPKPGKYYLRMWGIFGGDYGPVRVEFRGKPVGQLGVAGGPARRVHHVMPVALPWPWSPQDITLISEGRNGLAIREMEVTPIPPAPIRTWSAIGLFDKQASIDDWSGMEKAFPPEQKVDLAATYEGMNGATVAWRPIDLGTGKYVPLLEHFPYDVDRGNGVAYLAAWVRNPNERACDAVLYYAMDWYGKVWLNGHLVLPKVSGPWKRFAGCDVRLEPGWNSLLVKTATGRSGWKAAFALAIGEGELEYSATPPAAP